MANAVKKFRNWLADRRNFVFYRYIKDASEIQPGRSLIELLPEIKKKLADAVKNLPTTPPIKKRSLLSDLFEFNFI